MIIFIQYGLLTIDIDIDNDIWLHFMFKVTPFLFSHNFTVIIELLTVFWIIFLNQIQFFCIIINKDISFCVWPFSKEPTKHEIYLLKRDLPEEFFKKLMKIPQSQKKLKFPPKCNDSYYEHLLPSKIIIIVNINC